MQEYIHTTLISDRTCYMTQRKESSRNSQVTGRKKLEDADLCQSSILFSNEDIYLTIYVLPFRASPSPLTGILSQNIKINYLIRMCWLLWLPMFNSSCSFILATSYPEVLIRRRNFVSSRLCVCFTSFGWYDVMSSLIPLKNEMFPLIV